MRILVSSQLTFDVFVELIPPDTIAMLKAMIYEETRIQPCRQLLMNSMTELDDRCTLADENIQNGSTVYLFLRREQS
jgi:hypothetical protein